MATTHLDGCSKSQLNTCDSSERQQVTMETTAGTTSFEKIDESSTLAENIRNRLQENITMESQIIHANRKQEERSDNFEEKSFQSSEHNLDGIRNDHKQNENDDKSMNIKEKDSCTLFIAPQVRQRKKKRYSNDSIAVGAAGTGATISIKKLKHEKGNGGSNNNVSKKNNNNNSSTNIGNGNPIGSFNITSSGSYKIHFSTPQQYLQKKTWNKQFKMRKFNQKSYQQQYQQYQQQQQQQKQQQQQINKADMENIQNIRNQINNNNRKQQLPLQQQQHQSQQQQQSQLQKCAKKSNKKLVPHRGGGGTAATSTAAATQFSITRSKFFLPDKRPRKEVIIPPTKFLLGGNISDPLNLNGLQDESSNSTPVATPRQSPITTPPKVEVIIPPNIHDPLHLLDPVDTIEYEKQLVSPMKRKSKSKHRNRKKKTKRKKRLRNSSSCSIIITTPPLITTGTKTASANKITSLNDSEIDIDRNTLEETIDTEEEGEKQCGALKPNTNTTEFIKSSEDSGTSFNMTVCQETAVATNYKSDPVTTVSITTTTSTGTAKISTVSVENKKSTSTDNSENVITRMSNVEEKVNTIEKEISSIDKEQKMIPSEAFNVNKEISNTNTSVIPVKEINLNSIAQEPLLMDAEEVPSTPAGRAAGEREKAICNLHLDLNSAIEYQQQQLLQQQQNNSGSGSGRKRKISEGPSSSKPKFRRVDSMDKIVSPVVPQPGAWKRPPRIVPTGARKITRHRSTSASETDLISPTDEIKTTDCSENVFDETTPVPDDNKKSEETHLGDKPKTFPSMPKFKPEGAKYQYGNYDRYGGYRNLNEFTDVRLQVFQRNQNLFRGKDILDIGCNVGHITIAVAKSLAPKSILGIDIDPKLISKGRKNLSFYVRIPKQESNFPKGEIPERMEEEPNQNENKCEIECEPEDRTKLNVGQNNSEDISNSEDMKNKEKIQRRRQRGQREGKLTQLKRKLSQHKAKYELERNEFFPVSFPMCYGSVPLSRNFSKIESSSPNSLSSKLSASYGQIVKNTFPENVFFRTMNYVLQDESQLNNDTQQYDLILCLSVTKWIHLNFGDTGLKLAFKRMFNQLRPGGKLILEAQNWASYKKKKNLTETIYKNYRNIEFFPNKFHEYLLSNEVGFSHSYTLGVPRHLSKGFCRPIQLYAKGDFTPNHVRWSDAYYPQTPYEAYRGIYASMPPPPYPRWAFDNTPQHGAYNNSCQPTPMHPTSQYYNPLETDSYLPSYEPEVYNGHYVFASPLYQTVWSPPASLRCNSSQHTPVFGSVRESDLEDGTGAHPKHVYPPNDESQSPQVTSNAFSSIREVDSDDQQQSHRKKYVYAASCDNSSSSPNRQGVESYGGEELTDDTNGGAANPSGNNNEGTQINQLSGENVDTNKEAQEEE